VRTAEVADSTGYSVQQVRDLERLGVIPPASRAENGYRRFGEHHAAALRAYRGLAEAIGPVEARALLRDLWRLPLAEAAARVSSLHVRLAREREDALLARRTLESIRREGWAEPSPTDALSIAELAAALGVRSSALRFWEREGLLIPERVTSYRARRYPPSAVQAARIIVALRAAGYGIPSIRVALEAAHRVGDVADPLAALDVRLLAIAERTVALVEAGADLARLLRDREAPEG
jgi:DNA-binding transcriptional MerR regulator